MDILSDNLGIVNRELSRVKHKSLNSCNIIVMNFTKWLDQELKKRNWNRARLAKEAGFSEAAISLIFNRIINEPDILADIYEEAQAQEKAQDDVRDSQMARLKDEMRLNSQSIARMLSAIKEVGHSRALLIELQLLEAKQAELQQQITQLESRIDGKNYGANFTISSPDGKIHGLNLTISLDDIIANLKQALNIADDRQRAIVVRGFITRISARRDDGVISGNIIANPLGEREIVIGL